MKLVRLACKALCTALVGLSPAALYAQAPPAPTLVFPPDGATMTTSTPTFDWTDVIDPDGDTVTYDIQADNSGCSFASPEVNQTSLAASTHTPGSSLADGIYCWRARAVDQNGNASSWSATWNVTIDAVSFGSQTRSPTSSADCTTLGGPNANWSNQGNAASSNNQYATATVDGTVTDPLRCLNYAFSIPSNATILGIEINLERRSSRTQNGGSRDNTLFLVKAGSAVGANRATTTAYTTADVVELHGSSSDLWGTTWTPAEINAANFGTVYTGTKPNSAGQPHTISVDHIEITVYYSTPNFVPPGSFNAFETSTAANAIAGQVYTKRAAVSFAMDVVAILSGAQLASFTETVQVDLVTGSTGGADCPGAPATIAGTTQSVNLVGGRGTTGSFNVASAYADVRVRIRYPVASPTVTSCSTDNFAIRPSSITVSSSDATNNGTSGTPAIKTGANFSLTAATGVAGYNGTPSIDNTQVVGSPNAGTIGGSFGAANPATGAASGSSFSYSEVGVFGLSANAVRDTTFTAVDQPNDCTADFSNSLVGGKYGCYLGSTAIAMDPGTSGFGRFIPDHFALIASSITPRSDIAACSGSSFTYLGERMDLNMTLEARNASGAATTNYAGSWAKFDLLSGTYDFGAIDLAAPTLLTSRISTLPPAIVANWASGSAQVIVPVSIGRNAAPDGPYSSVRVGAAPVDEDNVTMGTFNLDADNSGSNERVQVGGNQMLRFGRLRLDNAVGSEKMDLPIPIQTQYWNGTAFQTNAADNCTTLSAGNIQLGSYYGGIDATNMNAANVSLGGAFSAGFGSLTLTKPTPTPASPGAVTVTVDLSAEAKSYLKGNWGVTTYTADPISRAAFGLYGGQPSNFIYFRENY